MTDSPITEYAYTTEKKEVVITSNGVDHTKYIVKVTHNNSTPIRVDYVPVSKAIFNGITITKHDVSQNGPTIFTKGFTYGQKYTVNGKETVFYSSTAYVRDMFPYTDLVDGNKFSLVKNDSTIGGVFVSGVVKYEYEPIVIEDDGVSSTIIIAGVTVVVVLVGIGIYFLV